MNLPVKYLYPHPGKTLAQDITITPPNRGELLIPQTPFFLKICFPAAETGGTMRVHYRQFRSQDDFSTIRGPDIFFDNLLSKT